MSETSPKRSIELIDAIESILRHKSYPLSLDYLALKLRRKYTMKTVNKPAFINMVQCEIAKYPDRIIAQVDGMFILAKSHSPTSSSSQTETTITTVTTTQDTGNRELLTETQGCEEELEMHHLTQEVVLLRELTTGCLALNHSLAGLITEKRRELEEINTDTNLLLAYHHTVKENGDKNKVTSQKKKYAKRSSKEKRDSKHKRKIITAKTLKRNLSLKTISVKKSVIKANKIVPNKPMLPLPPVSSPPYPSSPFSKPDSRSSEEGSCTLQNSNQSDDSISVSSTLNNSPSDNKPINHEPFSFPDSD